MKSIIERLARENQVARADSAVAQLQTSGRTALTNANVSADKTHENPNSEANIDLTYVGEPLYNLGRDTV